MGLFDVVFFKTSLYCPYCKEELPSGDSESRAGWQTKDFDPILVEYEEGQILEAPYNQRASFEAHPICSKCDRFISFNFAIVDGKLTAILREKRDSDS